MSARPGPMFRSAVLLAHRRRFVDATSALSAAHQSGQCTDGEALDLQAKMYAQQGLFLQAEACWRKALNLSGGKAEYAAALSRLQLSHGHRLRGVLLVVGLGLAVVLGLLTWQAAVVLPARQSQLLRSVAEVRDGLELSRAESVSQLADIRLMLQASSAAQKDRLDDVSRRMSGGLSWLASQIDEGRTFQGMMHDSLGAKAALIESQVESSRRESTASVTLLEGSIAKLRASSVEQRAADAAAYEEMGNAIECQTAKIEGLSSELGKAVSRVHSVSSEMSSLRVLVDRSSTEWGKALELIHQDLSRLQARVGADVLSRRNKQSEELGEP